ncbi:hypothetical protein [Streptomyces sp. NPDC058254]|uniref:hypothetical protein n=1 Tax=Streptomyces sp. NPDC058254 TaxID=3346406 RepID=UPI0036ED1E95
MKRFPQMLPAPSAVQVFVFRQTPESILEQVFRLDDAERELARFRAPFGVEDQGDREELLAIHAEARKQLGKLPARVGSHLRSLS